MKRLTKSKRLDCLALIRAPLEQYPPSLNQVALLAEMGLRVAVLDSAHPDYTPWLFRGPHRVERYSACRHAQTYKQNLPTPLVRLTRSLRFRRAARVLIAKRQPKVVLAYEPQAMWAVGKLWHTSSRPKLIWHFHELYFPKPEPSGWMTRAATRFACQHANGPDLLLFPDRSRAEVFSQAVGVGKPALVVMNCPRRVEQLPKNCLQSRLSAIGKAGVRLVYFQGWIGPCYCIEAIIESMKMWPFDAALVLVGPVTAAYHGSLEKVAAQAGVAERVIFLGAVPYADLLGLAVGATLGISLVSSESVPNWVYCAGASNKRFEYMAVGLAQVANRGHGMQEIIERPGCGLLADPSSPVQLAQAVTELLNNPSLRASMAERARTAHLEEFNYEKQFTPVVDQIREWCSAA